MPKAPPRACLRQPCAGFAVPGTRGLCARHADQAAQDAPRRTTSPVQRLRLRGRAGVRQRAAVFAQQALCVACLSAGRTTPATVVDHITPLAAGGSHDPSNLQPLCARCHRIKSAIEAKHR